MSDRRNIEDLKALGAGRPAPRGGSSLREAELFVSSMPAGQEGRVYLDGGKVLQPNPDKLTDYVAIEGVRRGHWPSSPDIAGATIDPEPNA